MAGSPYPSRATPLLQPLSSKAGCVQLVPRSWRSEEHTSELQSRLHLVCRLLLEKKKNNEHIPELRQRRRLLFELSIDDSITRLGECFRSDCESSGLIYPHLAEPAHGPVHGFNIL